MPDDPWLEVQLAQVAVCAEYGVEPNPPAASSRCGVSAGVGGSQVPLNGLRHPVAGDSNGWYLWTGETLSDSDDFFQPLHLAHLRDHAPEVLPYLGLPPGWRFLIAPGYEDVWFDENLLVID